MVIVTRNLFVMFDVPTDFQLLTFLLYVALIYLKAFSETINIEVYRT